MASISRKLSSSSVSGTEGTRVANTSSISGTVQSTLTNFGVPTGSTGSDARDRGGVLAPKLKYKFRVLVFNFGSSSSGVSGVDFTQQVVSVAKPKINFESVQMHSYNSRAYMLGKHEWQTISLTLRDDITNVMTRLVGSQLQRQINVFEQTSYAAGVNYKFDMVIDVLDGGNEVYLERWFVEGCYLQDINFSDMDYSSSDAQTIELTIRYDNATMTDGLMPSGTSEASETPGMSGTMA